MKIFIRTVILFVSFLLAMSCRNEADHVFLTVEDVADEKLAFQKGDLSKSQIASLFPEAETRYFSSTSEMLMSLSIHKFDACVVSSALADKILAELKDYALLEQPDSDCDSIKVVVHKSRIPGRNIENATHENIVNDFLGRINDSLLAGRYWKMILSGLGVTLAIFITAWLLAMLIALFMTLLGFVKPLKFIWRILTFFIHTIHDVPSIVLIFFFYYIVFARSDADAIYACIVALGVYSSGSFSKVISTQLNGIDPLQHKAAHMLGLKGWKKYRLVILPQAVKPMLPFLVSESKVLLRATTYAGYVSILDIVKVTEVIRNQSYETFIPLLFVSLVFLLLSWLIREGLYLSYKKFILND